MGSAMRISGGIATAAVMMTGMAVAQPAFARQTVSVPCSASALVTAVNAANAIGSGTLLLASSCDYVLTSASATGHGADGLLITGDISIIGGVSTRISRSSTAAPFRIMEVAAGAGLTLRNVFVSGGLADSSTAANDTGGGILNSRGSVTLKQVTVSGNAAGSGGGISNDSQRLYLKNTLVENNTAGSGGGGGIDNDGLLTLNYGIVRFNHANTNGGGIDNGAGGRTETLSTTITGNTAGSAGGGVYNAADGRLTLQSTLLKLNSATNGGGVYNAGGSSRVSVSNSTISSNSPNNCAPSGAVEGCTG